MLNSRARASKGTLFQIGRRIALAVLLLLILRVLGQGLLVGAAGAALVLFLQDLASPTPLFWAAPWEAMQLVVSRHRRVNHLWLHRTQDLARESIGTSIKPYGFATADGFVLIGVGRNKRLVQWTAHCAWRGIAQEREGVPARSCAALRFLLAIWFMIGGLLAVSIWHRMDLPTGLLVALIAAAAGHALATPVEKALDKWLVIPDWLAESSREFRLELEPVEFAEKLWCQGGEGFIVRRIPEEEVGED